jgi:hypothetical protein
MGQELWETKDGVKIPFSEVTHQHWSNIYWYHRYIVEVYEESPRHIYEDLKKNAIHIIEKSKEQIELRFAGNILDWIPIYDNEKKWYAEQSTRKVLIEKYRKPKVYLGAGWFTQ